MLKKKRKREGSDPGRPTKFQLRGEIVPNSKIERWENRMLKQGAINANDTFSDIGGCFYGDPLFSATAEFMQRHRLV
ncbi:hypothetical protein BCR34DRAFT_29511 [Clohesyomyces aquaticus]|uniref:Uncharacterized protein n=1 Tax=Clohesyomyces aquaticus TaxID=1231657 RepID=A0A1Y1Z9U2_9PLEO|nr:hypothetical protein BCR34DRAFT_29511 [Clohesyomyces aquaticus]